MPVKPLREFLTSGVTANMSSKRWGWCFNRGSSHIKHMLIYGAASWHTAIRSVKYIGYALTKPFRMHSKQGGHCNNGMAMLRLIGWPHKAVDLMPG
jgi:hypothetical protein